jgi:hypothetical protein
VAGELAGPLFNWDILRDGMTPRRGSVAFSRASTGTYIVSNVVTTATINTARIESDGLLIESANTNYALRSQDIAAAEWPIRAGVLSLNAVASPDGGTNASRLIGVTAVTTKAVVQKINQPASGNYCITVFAKPAGYSWVLISSTNVPGSNAVGSYFNLATNALGQTLQVNGSLISREITDAGGGWKRIKICYTHNSPAAGNGIQLYVAAADNVASFAGDGTSGIDFYGAEIKPTQPDSYIPTVASAATRSADVCTLTIPAGVSSILITYGDNSTATVSVTPGGTYNLPASVKKYKSIIALP